MTEDMKDKTPEDVKVQDAEDSAFEARLEVFTSTIKERLQKGSDYLTQEENVLVDLIKGGLETLKHAIEDPEEKEVTWENPWVEARYPVEWDWERGGLLFSTPDLPESVFDALFKGDVDPRELALSLPVREVMSLHLVKAYFPMFLQTMTKQVAIHVKGGEPVGYFFLDPKVKEELDALPTQEERDARMGELMEPFSIGGLVISEERSAVVSFGEIPPSLEEWEKTIENKLEDLPQLTFTGDVEGLPFRGSVVLNFHPLVVDEDKKEAYFPIVTGLVFAPTEEPVPEKWRDISEWAKAELALGPVSWSEKDREALWRLLLGDSIEELRKKLKPEVEEEVRAVQFFTPKEPEEATAALVPVSIGAPPPERRPTPGVAFGRTIASVQAMNILKDAYKVRLPKKWSKLPRWEKLMEDEVRDIQEEEGDRAFEDLRKTTGDKDQRGPLLRRVTKADGRQEVILTAEAQVRLRRRVGLGRGYVGIDKYGQERLFKLFVLGRGGLLEVSLSWHGLAGPLVDEWRSELKKQAEELARDLKKEAPLFAELDEEKRKRVDSLLSQITLWEDGRRVMEAILGQVGKQRRNPVEIPAESFRILFWPKKARSRDWPQNWKQRVEGALSALVALTFNVKTYRAETVRAYGSMVGQWVYKPLGPGAHGDGVYIIDVSSGFIGCLQVFQSEKQLLRSGREAVTFHFTKDLTKEERKARGWTKGEKAVDTFVSFDAGRSFYNAAAGLTSTQENLLHFIETNITLRKNTARKGNKSAQVHPKAKDADLPRLYGTDFCPLLPEGQKFFGALGHFTRNAEAGFTLWGTPSRPARHPGGLLFHMGHTLPSGSARAKRAEVVTKALEDIRAVVVDYLGGIVTGYNNGEWKTFQNFTALEEKTLTRRLRIFFFLPEDWEAKRRAKWEETTGRRVTEDVAEAERETWEKETEEGVLGSQIASEETGFRGWPLHDRLRAMMKRRGLRQKDLAPLFGVSPPVITYWLKGTEPEEDGKVHGLPIPEDVAPLVVRWVETGVSPTAEELKDINARRALKRPGKKKGKN